MSGPPTFFRNLFAGNHTPLVRVRRVAANLARRGSGRGCCGHYGDPGC
ncbi:MAG TPA: hypothetical protein VJR46_03915 [Candidatus Dormibacteraeota bacterium]|nr:hypothetical protein [Candidatus Dormibacteraeota bacterium]